MGLGFTLVVATVVVVLFDMEGKSFDASVVVVVVFVVLSLTVRAFF